MEGPGPFCKGTQNLEQIGHRGSQRTDSGHCPQGPQGPLSTAGPLTQSPCLQTPAALHFFPGPPWPQDLLLRPPHWLPPPTTSPEVRRAQSQNPGKHPSPSAHPPSEQLPHRHHKQPDWMKKGTAGCDRPFRSLWNAAFRQALGRRSRDSTGVGGTSRPNYAPEHPTSEAGPQSQLGDGAR